MIDSNAESNKETTPVQASGVWSRGESLPQQYVDEALFQYLNGRLYVTFGQIQLPALDPSEGPPETIEIRPVARLVFSDSSFHRTLDALNRIKDRVPNPHAQAGAEAK